jgi:hypothetical protein
VLFPQFTRLWAAAPDKRDPGLAERLGRLPPGVEVFQFSAAARFDAAHRCPLLPGFSVGGYGGRVDAF